MCLCGARPAAGVAVLSLLVLSSPTAVSAEAESEAVAEEQQTNKAQFVGPQSAASKLVLRTEDGWHFQYDDGSEMQDDIIFDENAPRPAFACGHALDGAIVAGASGGRAVDPGTIGMRRLHLAHAVPSSAASLLDNLRPFTNGFAATPEGSNEEKPLWITDAQVSVMTSKGSADGLPTLHAALEQPLPNGTTMEIPSDGTASAQLGVQYDCWRDGQATIELRFQVGGLSEGRTEPICIAWTKKCAIGWQHLSLNQGNTPVYKEGVLDESWKSIMSTEGTHDTVTKFKLWSNGLERLRAPTVSSNQKLVKVDLRGGCLESDDSDALEVGTEPVFCSVIYTCESDGYADVTLTFEKAVLSDEHRPEQMQLQWRKLCGATTYRHLNMYIKSDTYKNKTEAVTSGEVLPGFHRPCKTSSKTSGKRATQAPQADCEVGGDMLEIPPKDMRTSIELRVDKEGSFEPPAMQPPPDVSYDRKLMQVVVTQHPRGGSVERSGKNKSPKDILQTLNVKYTCFKDGVSVVMITIHVLAHKPIDLAWRKRCTEPKVRVGKTLTAPLAIAVSIFVLAVFAMVCCLVYVFCMDADDKKSIYKYDRVGERRDGDRDVEMSRTGEPKPTRLGGMEKGKVDGEVTYH